MEVNLKNDKSFFLIAGPCVIESKEICFSIADYLKELTIKLEIPYVFKASFTKANRTSVDSFAGPGLEKGLKILEEVKKKFELPILTDIHESLEADIVSEVVDIIQIPAFLSRQTFLLKAAAKTGKMVNVKKAQFMSYDDIQPVVKKLQYFDCKNIFITERGTSFGYHNLVVDFRGFKNMAELGFPIIYDVTHSLQRPSLGKSSGGDPNYAEMMAKAALATGFVDGLFIETHPNPKEALSDASTMINLKKIKELLINAKRIWSVK